jgi:serine/threonine protein kinase
MYIFKVIVFTEFSTVQFFRMTNPLQGLILEAKIAHGSTSFVWKARHIHSPLRVAMKRIPKDRQKDITRIVRETTLHLQMSHPLISKLFDVIETETDYFLIQEFGEHGSLCTFSSKMGPLPEQLARKYFTQLISAIAYLHRDRHIVHRDIKLENILLDRNDNIRLIDFGLSRAFHTDDELFKTLCGSPAYIAPEIIINREYTQSADIWSCGIVLFALVTGELPFYDQDSYTILQKICSDAIYFPAFLSPQLIDLLRQILCKDPARRITLDGICNHPWFSYSEFSLISRFSQISNERQKSEIDVETITKMETDGFDCREIAQSLLLEAKTEMTLLYQMYKQEIQTEKLDRLLRREDEDGNTGKVSSHLSADSVLWENQEVCSLPSQPLLGTVRQSMMNQRKYENKRRQPQFHRPTVGLIRPVLPRIQPPSRPFDIT